MAQEHDLSPDYISVSANVKQRLVAITEDKLELVLHRNARAIKHSRLGWVAPLLVLATLVLAVEATRFVAFAGLTAEQWGGAFAATALVVAAWLAWELVWSTRSMPMNVLVEMLKDNAGEVAPAKVEVQLTQRRKWRLQRDAHVGSDHATVVAAADPVVSAAADAATPHGAASPDSTSAAATPSEVIAPRGVVALTEMVAPRTDASVLREAALATAATPRRRASDKAGRFPTAIDTRELYTRVGPEHDPERHA